MDIHTPIIVIIHIMGIILIIIMVGTILIHTMVGITHILITMAHTTQAIMMAIIMVIIITIIITGIPIMDTEHQGIRTPITRMADRIVVLLFVQILRPIQGVIVM
jgi:hypothetical protein